ncbi:MAG: ATP-dependent DNA helicase RecG [Treponema sp.]|nr:ATP-dependent DNA helicase RecG [Treponema sp.]
MFIRNLSVPLNKINGIGSAAIPKLARLGIYRASDLLLYYPRGWEDRSEVNLLSGYNKGKICTQIRVLSREWIGYGKMRTLKVYIEDDSAQAALLCFNRPWLEKQLLEGGQYRLWGRFYVKYGELQSSSFEVENIDCENSFDRILPVYPLTSGVTQIMLRRFIYNTIRLYADKIENELPSALMEKYKLTAKNEAIKAIHFPSSMNELENAKKTLKYEELFYLEIMVGKRSVKRRSCININETNKKSAEITALQKKLIERLPFSLTAGQTESISDINRDMSSNVPMARLLQGDVGSGKTLVCFLAALKAVEEGAQAVIMAPTELLARQHAENAARLLEPAGIRVAFLTGNIKSAGRKELLKNLKAGMIDIIAGTHALFSSDVEYKNLKLVVIDEQHRFGVTQRALIMTKAENPDLLMMSATPIPRTLALTVFGDMDVSVIKDMPPGRKPVKTHLAKETNVKKVYDYVRKELELGRQAYFVYPLIESGDEIKDAVSMAENLSKKVFPQFRTSLIHSKLTEVEKRQTMDDFRNNKIQILAATSVVEVGVDVANATCMVIEHAERFGLSALHQLRGRVGRGSEQSYCFLVYSDELSEDGKARLKVMLENNDGFVIAEEDLKLRGPGIIAGTQQSGFLVLGIANPILDMEELQRAREDAFSILESDPDLLLEDTRIISRVLEEAPPFENVAL